MKPVFFRTISNSPALLLALALVVGLLYQNTNLPKFEPPSIAIVSDLLLAALLFLASSQIQLSQIQRKCLTTFRLSVVAAPVFLAITALTAYILLPELTLWPALLLGAVLMLNGTSVDYRPIINSSVSNEVKSAVRRESAAVLTIGIPFALLLEATALSVTSPTSNYLQSPPFEIVSGFCIGGFLGLLAAIAAKRMVPSAKSWGFKLSVLVAIIAFAIAHLIGGNSIIAAGAVGLLFAEDYGINKASFRELQKLQAVTYPLIYVAFGFILAPRLFGADTLILFFAIISITFLRAFAREVAVHPMQLAREEKNLLSWFGGTPGVGSAAFLLSITDNPMLADQESVLTVGAVCIVLSIISTRLLSRPFGKHLIQQVAHARKRRFIA